MIKAIGDKVVVEKIAEEGKSVSGIIMLNQVPDITRATVTSVGEKVLDVKVGDIVLFGKYTGNEVEVGSTKFTIVKEEEILAVEE